MKRILLLTAVFIMMLGTSFSFAQADADNFYKRLGKGRKGFFF